MRTCWSGPPPASATPAWRCRRSRSSPTRAGSPRRSGRRSAGVDPDDAHPLNLFRVHWFNGADRTTRRRRPRPRRAAARAHRRRGADRRRARRPLPDDPRAQGAGRLRLPRAAARHRAVRPDAQPRGLALHRQLLPRRRRHLADHGLPRRRGAAGGHEPGALRLARGLGRRSGATSSGRPAPRATSRRSTTRAPSSSATPRTSSSTSSPSSGTTSSTTSCTGAALGRVFETLQARRAGAAAARLHVGHRLGRDARRRRLPEGALRLADRRRRGARVPDDALQRLRRAQHPGHRRQAHPADPQRDEHRRRGGRLRPRDRPARRAVQHRRRARRTSPAGAACRRGRARAAARRSASRASATSSPRSRPPSTSAWAPTT